MNDDELDRTMAQWVAREERAAPSLRPRDELRARVAARRPRRRPAALVALAAAAALATALLLLRGLFAEPAPSEQVRIAAWVPDESVAFEGASLGPPGRGGPKSAAASFERLVLQRHVPGSGSVQGIDLLRGGEEPVELAVGERFRVGVVVAAARQAYLFLEDAAGASALFPPAGGAAQSRPGVPRWLPDDRHWYELLELGEAATLHVVASPEPLPQLDELVRSAQADRSPSARAALAAALRERLGALPREAAAVAVPLRGRR